MTDTLGSRIRFLREERRLSQLEMANELNISNVQLSRYESGARKPDPDMLVRIADFLNVSADYLLGRTAVIHEVASTYISEEDVRLLESLKTAPDVSVLIQDLIGHPKQMALFLKIWKVIKEFR